MVKLAKIPVGPRDKEVAEDAGSGMKGNSDRESQDGYSVTEEKTGNGAVTAVDFD